MDDVHEPDKSPHNPKESQFQSKEIIVKSAKMSHISSFRTPPKRSPMRTPKKRHKQESEATEEELEAKLSTDNQGVGVIGEVTPDSRSTSGIPSVMRTNMTTRRERGLSSGPRTHFGQKSSNQAEVAQSRPLSLTHDDTHCGHVPCRPPSIAIQGVGDRLGK